MNIRSIRWRLQSWYSAILLLTISSLLSGFYYYQKAYHIAQIDSDLSAPLHPLHARFLRTSPEERAAQSGKESAAPAESSTNKSATSKAAPSTNTGDDGTGHGPSDPSEAQGSPLPHGPPRDAEGAVRREMDHTRRPGPPPHGERPRRSNTADGPHRKPGPPPHHSAEDGRPRPPRRPPSSVNNTPDDDGKPEAERSSGAPGRRMLARAHEDPKFITRLEAQGYYFGIWNSKAEEIYRSPSAPSTMLGPSRPHRQHRVKENEETRGETASQGATGGDQATARPPRPRTRAGKGIGRWRGGNREVTLPGRDGIIIAGLPGDLANAENAAFAWKLVGIGGGIYTLALLGGWWFAGRSLRPIQQMSLAARSIADGDLSQRIPVTETENELSELASVLNSSFDKLEGLLQQQAQFTADASHELRTPLTVIHTEAQAALLSYPSKETLAESFEVCLKSTRHMRDLIASMLDLARLDSGETEFGMELVDLAQVAEDSVDLVRPLTTEKAISLELDLEPIRAFLDPDKIRQVVVNLVSNAIQHTPPEGQVTITVRGHNPYEALLEVKDTGSGIAERDLEHIFERFYRTDKARSRGSGGSGLGLAITKAIVEAHRGSVEVISSLDKGTTLQVLLPRDPATSDS